jgi:membrane-associated phospholipid phosphatase
LFGDSLFIYIIDENGNKSIILNNPNYQIIIMMFPVKEAMQDYTALGGLSLYALFIIIFMAAGSYIMAGRLALALLILYAVVIVIRLLYFKERPEKRDYGNMVERLDASSFPSMHTARASSLAMILGAETTLAVFIILIAAAIGIGMARILLKKHDIADVIVGFVIGILIGYIAMAIISPLPGMCELLRPATCFHFN